MTQVLIWLAVVELIGLAWLPLCLWLFRGLPDRGYAFSKVLGLLLVTYITWLVGSALPVAGSAVVPMIAVCGGASTWWFFRGELRTLLANRRTFISIEEGVFILTFIGLSLMRVNVFDGSIQHTEQFMDLNFLQGSMHSVSYPPYDGWMSGRSINYYYFGYLMVAVLAKISGTAPTVAYNLALSTIFAASVSGAYSIGFAVVRKYLWAAVAPLFVCLIGNWHALLWQVPHSGCSGSASPNFWDWLWQSTRVVDNRFTLADWPCNAATHAASNTINEYPLFSFVLGDLHPHVMSLPITLLAVALGCSLVLMRTPVSDRVGFDSIGRLALCGLCVGSLFTVNSWDYPTYALFVAACIVLGIYLNDLTTEWWKRCVLPLCIFGSISLLLYAPFYVHFRSLAHGVGVVSRPTDVFEFFQVFGLLFLAPALLVLALCLLVRPTEERVTEEPFDSDISTRGSAMAKHEVGMTAIDYALIVAVFIVGGVILHRIVLLLALGLVGAAGTALYRVVNTDEPNRADALALLLVILGGSVLALTEVLYLRDVFDGGTSYRMNTVFKFYYQAWVLLSLSAAYAAFRAPEVLRLLLGLRYARLALALVTLGTAGAAVYTWFVPSYAVAFSHQRSMDGMAWVRHQYPDDYAAIQWLNGHALGTPVILEATQGEYGYFSRISTFSGLPTVMGWAGHENQWRPGDQDIARRIADVKSIYTSDANSAQQLLRRYDVRYVIVGDPERQAYGNGPGLHKFGTFMREAFRSGTTTVYVRA